MTSEAEIRTKSRPTCALCGREGEFLYLKQIDRMFGAPGEWNLKRCTNEQCLLVWLDPMPVEEDIGKAYARYYTHAPSGRARCRGVLNQIFLLMKREYLAEKYEYELSTGWLRIPWVGRLLRLFPSRHAEADGEVRFLDAVPQGRLLDIGCGSGDWLLSMRELGWDETGVDPDDNAARVGRERGLNVNCGALEQQNFPNDSFDAVTLNHVIEHVPDPIGTLMECIRILKPGGKLVVFTPNWLSLGHQIYGEFWRGLEPPRHLHIFSFESLHGALGLAGFKRSFIFPWIATSMIYESYLLKRGWRGSVGEAHRHLLARLCARFFSAAERLLIKWNPSVADCVVAIAVK